MMIILGSKRHFTQLQKAEAYSEEVLTLKREIADLRIERNVIREKHEKEERELRHMIGLEKRRQEFEIEQASKSAALKVREENLSADQKRFEEQLTFNTQRFEKMETYLKEMTEAILKRLPTVGVRLTGGVGVADD